MGWATNLKDLLLCKSIGEKYSWALLNRKCGCPPYAHSTSTTTLGPAPGVSGRKCHIGPPGDWDHWLGPQGADTWPQTAWFPLSRLFVFLLTWHTVHFQELFWTVSSGLSPFRLMSSLWLADDVRHDCKTPAGGPDIKRGGEPIRVLPCCFLFHAQIEAKEYCLYLGYGWMALAGQAVSL